MDDPMSVRTRADLAAFVAWLAADLDARPAAWENVTLSAFLNALSRYVDDLPGWCKNNEPGVDADVAQWRLFAVVLAGAAVYE